MGDLRRNTRPGPVATGVAIACAVGIHAAWIAAIHDVGSVAGEGAHGDRVVRTLQSGCAGDAALASAARFAVCFSPWQSDLDTCFHEATLNGMLDLSSCQAAREPNPAQVAMIEPERAARLKALDPKLLLEPHRDPDPPAPPPPAVVPPEPQPPMAQVVETAKPSEENSPKQARFLAEYDTEVAKQTVARGSVATPMTARAKAPELEAKRTPPEDSERHKVDHVGKAPGALAMRSPGSPALNEVAQDRSTSALPGECCPPWRSQGYRPLLGGPAGIRDVAPDGYLEKKPRGALAHSQGTGRSQAPRGAGGGMPAAPSLKPSPEALERALGGGNVDHLPDVDQGDETALSAKRWIHASFFNRLKRQVAQSWDPASVWRRTDPGGQVYGTKTRITEVRVSLSSDGQLANIAVTTPSGVAELDEEALRAFRAAAPFPNPPLQLAGVDHLITFAFAFYFEIGAPRTSWRVIRSM